MIVVYDANVLYPFTVRDILIQLATTEVFKARWSEEVNDEWIRNLLVNSPNLDAMKVKEIAKKMGEAVRDCLIEGYENLIPSIQLPDPDDRHVVAAAIKARADLIVTFNLKDFPQSALADFQIEAVHPDNFILDVADLAPRETLLAAQLCWKRRGKPPLTWDEFLRSLERANLPKTSAHLSYLSGM